MQLINSILKRILWSVLIGGVFAEWSGMMDSNPGMIWVFVIPIYIILTLIYNRYIWKTAKAPNEEILDEEEPDFDWEDTLDSPNTKKKN